MGRLFGVFPYFLIKGANKRSKQMRSKRRSRRRSRKEEPNLKLLSQNKCLMNPNQFLTTRAEVLRQKN